VIDTLCSIINVIPRPEMQMDLDFCTPLVCWGDSTACIKATVQNGTPDFTYQWSTGQNHTITNRSDSLVDLPLGFYSVTVSDVNGCSLTDTLTVSPIDPPLSLSLNKVDVTCVRGSDGLITANPSGGTIDYAYQWNPANLNTQLIGNLPTGMYCVTVTDALGCTITACDTLIELHERPPANITSNITEGCQPLTVQFYEPSPIEGQTYKWDFFDGIYSNLREPIHNYLNPGSFDVSLTVTSVYGCDSTITKNQMINVWPKPVAAFTQFPNSVDLIDPQVYYHNNSTGLVNSWWDFGDHTTSSDTHPTHRYEDAGQYTTTLIAISDKGCLDTATYQYINVSDYWTIYVPTAFTPTGDDQNDEFRPIHHNISSVGYLFRIFDRWGKLVFETTDPYKGWDGSIDGKMVKSNTVFTWTLEFYDMFGLLQKRDGTVTLVRPF
jgi:gliding motility-associated-like protein